MDATKFRSHQQEASEGRGENVCLILSDGAEGLMLGVSGS